jgi:hypothetical protein
MSSEKIVSSWCRALLRGKTPDERASACDFLVLHLLETGQLAEGLTRAEENRAVIDFAARFERAVG